jgi:hypothetical protein
MFHTGPLQHIILATKQIFFYLAPFNKAVTIPVTKEMKTVQWHCCVTHSFATCLGNRLISILKVSV